MAGTVSRFIGAGVGVARLVAVSIVKVVDMGALYPSAQRGANWEGKMSGMGAPLIFRGEPL